MHLTNPAYRRILKKVRADEARFSLAFFVSRETQSQGGHDEDAFIGSCQRADRVHGPGGTSVPLEGVRVELGTESVVTRSDGQFSFSKVKAGEYDISFSLAGYTGRTENISVSADREVDVTLNPTGGAIHATGALDTMLKALDGRETDDTTVRLSGNISDFSLPAELTVAGMNADLQPLTTLITIDQLEALVNGVIYVVGFDSGGSFDETLPIDPGSNTIQLRVRSTDGDAYTTPIIVVTVTFDRLDLRVLLRWDTTGDSDVDLHMFKGAENPPADYNSWWDDQHVYWRNKTPGDFGSTREQNPFLDIDNTVGYGPETIVLQEATEGQYHIWVHLFNQGDHPVTNATVDVILNDPSRTEALHERFQTELTEDWEVWYVATVNFPGGTFTTVEPEELGVDRAALQNMNFEPPAKLLN
jgi:uncharacterized protein YfaP (DUF2135 family)